MPLQRYWPICCSVDIQGFNCSIAINASTTCRRASLEIQESSFNCSIAINASTTRLHIEFATVLSHKFQLLNRNKCLYNERIWNLSKILNGRFNCSIAINASTTMLRTIALCKSDGFNCSIAINASTTNVPQVCQ